MSHRRVIRGNWLERKILLGVLSVVNRPKLTLAIAALVLAVSVLAALRWLEVSSDQDKLFSPKLKAFADYVEFDRQFPENDALFVVIEKRNPKSMPPVRRWTAAADAVGQSIRKRAGQYVFSVDERIPLDKLGGQKLLFLRSNELHDTFAKAVRLSLLVRQWGEVDPAGGFIAQGKALLMGKTPSARLLSAIIGDTFSSDPDSEGIVIAQHAVAGWNETLAHPTAPIQIGGTVPNLAELDADPGDLGYYWEPDETDPAAKKNPDQAKHLLIVRVYPRVNYGSLSATAEPVAAIRAAIKAVAKDFPEFTFGTTGRPALDADEMSTTDRDSNIAEAIAAVAVFIGLLVMLRSVWLALAAEIALAVGIGWTFGWATLSVGGLNLLSIVFLIALIGIGMDYLVQVLTRYRMEARLHARPKAIWARVFRNVAAPINTACFGAAGAFLVAVFTRFRGAADLGIIAGGGLLLCLLSGYTVLPALLTLFPARIRLDIARRPIGLPSAPQGARRLILPAMWVCLIAGFSPWAMKAHFDPNLLDLQAPKLESTQLIKKLQTWSSVVMTKDKQMLTRVRSAVQRVKVVAKTESILDAEDNYDWLSRPEQQKKLPKFNWPAPPAMTPADVDALATKAMALADRLGELPPGDVNVQAQRNAAIAEFRAFADAIAKLSPEQRQQAESRLSIWQNVFDGELRELLGQFSPQPLDLSKIPAELRSHWISADNTYVLYISPNPDDDLGNDRRKLARFVNEVNDAVATVPNHPGVTGLAPNIYYTTREVRDSFKRGTIIALILIVTLVLIDLRNIVHTLLAVSVLALGLPLLVELMGFLNVNWNFANFFGLPILIGAGHEYGVFMVHRYREALRDPRRAWGKRDVADRALLLCAYITSSSFGFFWAISEHRGLKSLGLVMALGTACIYLSTVMVLRPLLLWRLERRKETLKDER